jgi:hypothetical protein
VFLVIHVDFRVDPIGNMKGFIEMKEFIFGVPIGSTRNRVPAATFLTFLLTLLSRAGAGRTG